MTNFEEHMQVIKTNEEVEEEAADKLEALFQGDETLSKAEYSRDELLYLTRARRCRAELSYKMVKTVLQYKNKTYPELLNIEFPQIKHVIDSGAIKVLKRMDHENPAVLVFQSELWDTRKMSFDAMIMAGLVAGAESALKSVETQRNGILILMDLKGYGFSHARQTTYGNVSKMVNCIIFGAPFNVIGCAIINTPYVFTKVYQVVKFAIPERYRSYVSVMQNDFTEIHKKVSPSVLPQSLGGKVSEEDAWETTLKDRISDKTAYEYLNRISSL